jgi:dTDP-4-dehydrorhamnose reductase
MKFLVVGAGGQLGQAMVGRLQVAHEVAARTSADLDITRSADVAAAVASARPDVIVNCAAYNDVDGAQTEPMRALAVNAWGPLHLARAARVVDATLVHFSTDFVFDGETSRPYVETDAPNPQGTYAASKLLGEWFAAEAPRGYVLRVESLFGGPKAKSSIDLLLKAIMTSQEARAFSDRVVSPSYVDDVVGATIALFERQAPMGLYHCVNSGMATWVEVARELARLTGRPAAPIKPILLADLALKTPRPRFAALSNAKLASAGIELPSWESALARYVTSVQA